jgi:hypothetical protein
MAGVGFVRPVDRGSLIVASDAASLLAAVATFTPPRRRYDRTPDA